MIGPAAPRGICPSCGARRMSRASSNLASDPSCLLAARAAVAETERAHGVDHEQVAYLLEPA